MSKERELLKKIIAGDDEGDFFISHRLYQEIRVFLAQPEQEPTLSELDRELLKQACKSLNNASTYLKDKNVDIEHVRLMVEDAVGDIYAFMSDKSAPPKREPLGVEEINECMENSDSFGFNGDVYIADAINAFENFARAIEKEHGIGVDDE